MIQLYFLSILFNGLAGFLFMFGETVKDNSIESSMQFSLFSEGFRLVLGVLTAITAILKFLAPMGMPVLGDFLPAFAGAAAGFILIFGFYREHSSKIEGEGGSFYRFGDICLNYKKAVGVLLLLSALLHFLIPRALIL